MNLSKGTGLTDARPSEPTKSLDNMPMGVQHMLNAPIPFPVNVLQLGAYIMGLVSGAVVSFLLIAITHRGEFDPFVIAFWGQVWGLLLTMAARWLFPGRGGRFIPVPLAFKTLRHVGEALKEWSNEPNLEFQRTKVPITLLTGAIVGFVVAGVTGKAVASWGWLWIGFEQGGTVVGVVMFWVTLAAFYFVVQGKAGVLKSLTVVFALPAAYIASQITLGPYAILSALLVIAQVTLVLWKMAPKKSL